MKLSKFPGVSTRGPLPGLFFRCALSANLYLQLNRALIHRGFWLIVRNAKNVPRPNNISIISTTAQIEILPITSPGRSLMYSKERITPRMGSRGAPVLTSQSCEDIPFRTKRRLLLRNHSLQVWKILFTYMIYQKVTVF